MNRVAESATRVCVRLGLFCVLIAAMSVAAFAQKAPTYKVDATWPKLPLPNKWTFGGVTGMTVDSEDVVWISNRSAGRQHGELRDV